MSTSMVAVIYGLISKVSYHEIAAFHFFHIECNWLSIANSQIKAYEKSQLIFFKYYRFWYLIIIVFIVLYHIYTYFIKDSKNPRYLMFRSMFTYKQVNYLQLQSHFGGETNKQLKHGQKIVAHVHVWYIHLLELNRICRNVTI